MQNANRNAERLQALLSLTLSPEKASTVVPLVAALSTQQRQSFLLLAHRNHVIVRAFTVLQQACTSASMAELTAWTIKILEDESTRINRALPFLDRICQELEDSGCPVTVLKSLDHFPDLGNDLDLYTIASSDTVITVMEQKFGATQQPRSAGDKLAHKWNFTVPGLTETVEIHVQRLGQVGEHTNLAHRFITRRRPKTIGRFTFQVPAEEEMILAATLQRMYRHFFLRVCDIVNTTRILGQHQLNFMTLKQSATLGSIWPGVATYLNIVANYARDFHKDSIGVPDWVSSATLFGNEKLYCTKGPFLRIPMVPEVGKLYASQLTRTALGGHISAAFRLALLPGNIISGCSPWQGYRP